MTAPAWRRSNIVAGTAGLLIGIFAIWESWDYPMGSMTRMGPGYFPFLLGIAMAVLSFGVILFEGRQSREGDIPKPSFAGLIWISLAVSAFALLAESMGLVPAIIAAVFLSARADRDLTLKETGVLAVATAAVCTGIFIFILGLPLEAVRF